MIQPMVKNISLLLPFLLIISLLCYDCLGLALAKTESVAYKKNMHALPKIPEENSQLDAGDLEGDADNSDDNSDDDLLAEDNSEKSSSEQKRHKFGSERRQKRAVTGKQVGTHLGAGVAGALIGSIITGIINNNYQQQWGYPYMMRFR
ncbi:hypothetical protein DdX_14958 [Ditylenchus destructor]|uniref:Uncharacterized protein n=1 Tax=Ditylenchus destructor TaxID=166010 RepID=A0AAD4MQ87_9BILA|nr:hypothetical protein DdX_14958 [Ditylenchus destructor]